MAPTWNAISEKIGNGLAACRGRLSRHKIRRNGKQDAASGGPPFRFLDLDPHLRDLVYEIAATSDETTGQSSFRALTQTCRQVKMEFRALYLNIKTFPVTEAEVMPCLEALYPGCMAPSTNKCTFVASLLILQPTPTITPYYTQIRTSNILPIITALTGDWPGLKIRSTEASGLLNQVLNIMLKHTANSASQLRHALKSLTLEIRTGNRYGSVHCELELNDDYVNFIRRTNSSTERADTFRTGQPVCDSRVTKLISSLCFAGARMAPTLVWSRRVPREDPLCAVWRQDVMRVAGVWTRLDHIWM
ncbi:hypothetical protein IAQ61_003271 [Plenodomus lingam]|uniref:uncharacterized protein n=1 Tax=Leptosphaeria maculans TaxID=5022 RepID=UPI00331CF550|nr:hypothetical protein IAQ61_003271 [Plenodomus lingam]